MQAVSYLLHSLSHLFRPYWEAVLPRRTSTPSSILSCNCACIAIKDARNFALFDSSIVTHSAVTCAGHMTLKQRWVRHHYSPLVSKNCTAITRLWKMTPQICKLVVRTRCWLLGELVMFHWLQQEMDCTSVNKAILMNLILVLTLWLFLTYWLGGWFLNFLSLA